MRQISLVSVVVVLLLCGPLWSAAAPATAPSCLQYRQQLVDLFLQRLTSKSKVNGTAWEKPGNSILRQTAEAMANDRIDPLAWPAGSPTPQSLAQLADEALKANCDDPTILFCCMRAYVRTWRDDEARAIGLKLKDITARQVPGLIVFFIDEELANLAPQMDGWTDIYPKRDAALNTFLASSARPMNDGHLRLILQLLKEDAERHTEPGGEDAVLNRAVAMPRLNPWLKEIIPGEQEIKAAWQARGSGWAAEVPPGAWPIFKQHIDTAKAHLTAATRINSALPEAWTDLITIAMANSEPLADPFEHGLTAEVDNPDLWQAQMWALHPRWGGSHEQMLETATQAVRNGRYDTLAPLQYIETMNLIESDATTLGGASTIWQDPLAVDRAMEVLDNYVKANNDPQIAGRWLEKLEEVAFKAGRYQIVAEADERIQTLKPAPTSMPAIGGLAGIVASNRLIISQARGLSGVHDADERAINGLVDANKWVDAWTMIDKLDKAIGPSDPLRPFVAHVSAVTQAQLALAAGEWADLTPRQEMAGWRIRGGQWRWFDNAIHAMSTEKPMEAWSNVGLQGPIEIDASLNFERPTVENHAGAGLRLEGAGGSMPMIGLTFYPLYGMLKYWDSENGLADLNVGSSTKLDFKLSIDQAGVTLRTGSISQKVGEPQIAAKMMAGVRYVGIVQDDAKHLPLMRLKIDQIRIRTTSPAKTPPGAPEDNGHLPLDGGL